MDKERLIYDVFFKGNKIGKGTTSERAGIIEKHLEKVQITKKDIKAHDITYKLVETLPERDLEQEEDTFTDTLPAGVLEGIIEVDDVEEEINNEGNEHGKT